MRQCQKSAKQHTAKSMIQFVRDTQLVTIFEVAQQPTHLAVRYVCHILASGRGIKTLSETRIGPVPRRTSDTKSTDQDNQHEGEENEVHENGRYSGH